MLKTKPQLVIAVYNDTVCWISGDPSDGQRAFFQLPLQQLLEDETSSLPLPEWLKNKQRPICIVPDHWFGSQSYPFQSKKPALIEPFLERKLTGSYPDQKAIRHFFSYRHVGDRRNPELMALFLHEDAGFQLYTALKSLNHTPQQITAPVFLWEERLQQSFKDFSRQGALLIHMAGLEGHLYFYFNGNYQFSRMVPLANGADDLNALGFEINQSLYMFSQKTKHELDCIYMRCDTAECQSELSEILGRDIICLESPAPQGMKPDIPAGMEPLCNLLEDSPLERNRDFFGVMHRQVKQAMAWKPVQWAGICIGLCVLCALSFEHFFLNQLLNNARIEYQSVQEQMADNAMAEDLTDQSATLDQVLELAHHSALADAAHRITAGFPAGTQLKELDFRNDSPPTLKIVALVAAHNADELQVLLSRFIIRMEEKFKTSQPLTLNDIDIRLNRPGIGAEPNRYQITFQMEPV